MFTALASTNTDQERIKHLHFIHAGSSDML